jgi:hypothetical protein
VEGASGCGKTRTALRLIQTLARDRRLCELANRCYLYDFAESEFAQDELLRKLGTSRHDEAVVFVDNFQHVRPSVLGSLTRRLLEGSAAPPERLVVFLARPADAWNLSPRSDVRLLAEAKTGGHYIGLEGASPNTLLETFRGAERAVLLGTRAFWEGVDIPGDALSVLVITKLPFDVPSDPIVAARAETFEDPFNEFHLPEAILRFRQGFGRLIRRAADRGVVILLDSRAWRKDYGSAFLDSLPECTVRRAPLQNLGREVRSWLGRPK